MSAGRVCGAIGPACGLTCSLPPHADDVRHEGRDAAGEPGGWWHHVTRPEPEPVHHIHVRLAREGVEAFTPSIRLAIPGATLEQARKRLERALQRLVDADVRSEGYW